MFLLGFTIHCHHLLGHLTSPGKYHDINDGICVSADPYSPCLLVSRCRRNILDWSSPPAQEPNSDRSLELRHKCHAQQRFKDRNSTQEPTDSSWPQEKPDHFLQPQSSLEQSHKPAAFSNHLRQQGQDKSQEEKKMFKIIIEIHFSVIQNYNEIAN